MTLYGPTWRNHIWLTLNHRYLDVADLAVFTDGTAIDRTIEGWQHRDRLTWQASARNRIEATFTAEPVERRSLGVGALTAADAGYRLTRAGPAYQLRWNAYYSPITAWEALAAFSDTTLAWDPETRGKANNCVSDPVGYLDPGRRFGQPIDRDFCVDGNTARGDGSYWRDLDGRHLQRIFQIEGERFIAGFADSGHRFTAGLRVEDLSGDYRREERLQSIYEPLDPGQPRGGWIYREAALMPEGRYRYPTIFDRSLSAEGLRYAAWIEDSFRPRPNLSIRLGLRFQREELSARGFEPFSPEAEHDAFFRRYNQCMEIKWFRAPWIPYCRRLASKVFTGHENEFNVALLSIVLPRRPSKVREPERFTIVDASLAPRLSVSWDPWNDGRTRVFATWGRHHGTLPLLPLTAEQGPNIHGQGFPVHPSERLLPDGRLVTEQVVAPRAMEYTAFSVSQVDRNLRSPYTDELTLGMEREIATETTLGITYIRRKHCRQLQDRDVNHYPRDLGDHCLYDPRTGEGTPAGEPDGVPDDCIGRRILNDWDPDGQPVFRDHPDGRPDLYLYNPLFNQVLLLGNFNESDHEAVEVALRRRYHRGWDLEASYVWSRSRSQADHYDPLQLIAPFHLEDRSGLLPHDRRHLVRAGGMVDLPWWRDAHLGGAVTWESGLPYSRREHRPVFDARSDHAGWRFRYFRNMTVYRTDERNDRRSESFWTVDLGLQKEFEWGPVVGATRLDVFNLLNDDRLHILGVTNGHLDGERRFGRRYRIALQVNF